MLRSIGIHCHFASKHSSLGRIVQRSCQPFDRRWESIIGKCFRLLEKPLLTRGFTDIVIGVPYILRQFTVFVRLGVCKLFRRGVPSGLQQLGNAVCRILIGQHSGTRRAGIMSACDTDTVRIKPQGVVDIVDTDTLAADAVFPA